MNHGVRDIAEETSILDEAIDIVSLLAACGAKETQAPTGQRRCPLSDMPDKVG